MAIVKLETGEELEFDNKYSNEQISQAVEKYSIEKDLSKLSDEELMKIVEIKPRNIQPKMNKEIDIYLIIAIWTTLVILVGFLAIKFIYNKDKVFSFFLKIINKFINFISTYTPIFDICNKAIKSSKYFLHYFGKFLLFSIKWGLILWIGYLILQALKENLLGLIAGLLGIIIYQLNEIRIILLRRDCARLDNDV